jgi:hypothetical protein
MKLVIFASGTKITNGTVPALSSSSANTMSVSDNCRISNVSKCEFLLTVSGCSDAYRRFWIGSVTLVGRAYHLEISRA